MSLFLLRRHRRVASARYSSLASWLPRYSISSLSPGTFVHIQIHADQVARFSRKKFISRLQDRVFFLPFFLIHLIEVARVNENMKKKRRYCCAYPDSCNSVALLNQSAKSETAFCIALTGNSISQKTSTRLVLSQLHGQVPYAKTFLIESSPDFPFGKIGVYDREKFSLYLFNALDKP